MGIKDFEPVVSAAVLRSLGTAIHTAEAYVLEK